MNILRIKPHVKTDVKGSTEGILFPNNPKDGKLVRITSSYKQGIFECMLLLAFIFWGQDCWQRPLSPTGWNDGAIQNFRSIISVLYSVSDKILGRRQEGPSSG